MKTLVAERLSKCYRINPGKWTQRWLQPLRRPLRYVGVKVGPVPSPMEVWALRDVSFELERGTRLGVIGPNGAGKTTLLKVLGRIVPPTSGRAMGRGRVVSMLEIGSGLNRHLTGRENIMLNAALFNIPKSVVESKLDKIIEFSGLGDFIDVAVRRYSTGMYLRLAFSVVMGMVPEILLADEVLAVGDMGFQDRCLRLIEEEARGGMTVLFVSHDMEAIKRLCNRVLWIHKGEVMALGDPESVVEKYRNSSVARAEAQLAGGGPACTWGRIPAVRLLSAKEGPIGAVRVCDDFLVELEFEALEAGYSAMCYVDLSTSLGIKVFRNMQAAPFEVGERGIYRCSMRIPAYLLSDEAYVVDANVIGILPGGDQFLCAPGALTFRVYDTEEAPDSRTTLYKGRAVGVVRPRLQWDVKRESPPPPA